MRFLPGLMFVASATCVFAQAEDPPEVLRAKAGIERLRSLVDAGVAPRVLLVQAETAIADAEDAALLRRTVYGNELTEDQVDEMLAAAARRLERRQKALDTGRNLVDGGVAALDSLTPLLEELDAARKEQDLARSRAQFTRELAHMARAEELVASTPAQDPRHSGDLVGRYDGDGIFTMGTFARVELAFQNRFGKPLPVSAMGETALHRSLGFDHRGRVDVALHPDQPEGHWLLVYLVGKHIPYFAFRQAVPGKATGAHIHIGTMSTHFKLGG
jgi:hypothetical protein